MLNGERDPCLGAFSPISSNRGQDAHRYVATIRPASSQPPVRSTKLDRVISKRDFEENSASSSPSKNRQRRLGQFEPRTEEAADRFHSLKIGLADALKLPPSAKRENPVEEAEGSSSSLAPKAEIPREEVVNVKELIRDSMMELRSAIRNDVQNLHVEMIKQSLAQQVAIWPFN